jgi:hypothetical protein
MADTLPSPAHPSDASSLSPPSPIRSTKSEFSQCHPIHSITFSTTPTSSDALLGNQQHQVLESWGELFSNLNEPRQHAPAPLPLASDIPPNGSHKRHRQQRIAPVGHDQNTPYGDAMQAKRVGLSRFYFINPNGISYHRNLLDFCEILQSFIDNGIDVCGLSEINLDALLQPSLRKQLEDMSQDFFGTSIVATSTSYLRSQTPYKPGGTLTGISNELCGRYKTSGSDPHGLGRWSYIQLYAKGGRSMIIVTACRVCEGNVSASGASTAFHQQWNILRRTGHPTPNPRKQFVTDLILEIEKWQRAGADIILGGDLNERLGDTQNGIANLVTKCGLVDPHASAHGIAGEPSTHSRGSKCLDYVLVSSAVLPFIRKCGIDPFHQILFTDHRGLFLDIDLKGLLGGELAQILAPKSRGVSSNTDKPEVYIQASHQHLSSNNVSTNSASMFAAARTVHTVPNALITAINKFDRTITQGMPLAERLCRRKPRAAWSAAIATASRTVKFWKTLISGFNRSALALNGTTSPSTLACPTPKPTSPPPTKTSVRVGKTLTISDSRSLTT